ncbi:PAS domain S-box protein [Streptomyces sp. NPDC015492]|uniref:PAS domain S-box protein n=1 Tax=Streptomyces sp. NPDC015492 TaxID=3364958 RepID=UPI0036FEEB88
MSPEGSTGHAPRPHREVWDFLPDAVLIVDGNGTVVRANPAAAALLGRERPMVEGRGVLDFLPAFDWNLTHPPKDPEDAETLYAARLRTTALTADGETFAVEIGTVRLDRHTLHPSMPHGSSLAPRHRPGHRHGSRWDAPHASSAGRQRQHLRPGTALGGPGGGRRRRHPHRARRRTPPADRSPPIGHDAFVAEGRGSGEEHGADDRTGETVTSAPCGMRAGDALSTSGGRGAGRRCPGDAGGPLARSRSMAHACGSCAMCDTGYDTSACGRPTPRQERCRRGTGAGHERRARLPAEEAERLRPGVIPASSAPDHDLKEPLKITARLSRAAQMPSPDD